MQRLRRFQLPITLLVVALGAGLGYLFGHKAKSSSEITYHQLTFRKGTVLSARFAPDNRTVIYSAAWGGSPPELFSTRQDSIESRPVGLSQVDLLGISSQGELAVSLKPIPLQGFFGTQGTLGRTPLTGGTSPREMLENVEWSDWSPDGSSLLVVRTVDNENRIEYPAGKVVYKATAPAWISHPRLSRDGKRIAFCHHPIRNDDRGAITIINSDGSRNSQSFGDFSSLYGLAWSPKDDEVWFTADPTVTTIARRLMAVSMSGAFRLLAAAPGDLTLHDVSADGTAVIAIDDRERKIFFTDSKTPERELTWLDRAVLVAFSQDGKLVVFHEGGKGGGSHGTIFLRKTDGAPAVRLGEGYAIALSPDQKWVLDIVPTAPPRFALIPTGAGEVVDLKPSGIENLTPLGFAADSRHVVLLANESGHKGRLYSFDPASAKLQPLTPEGTRGTVTPDGKFLLVRSDKPLPDLISMESGLPIREIKGVQSNDRALQVSDDGKIALVANLNGMTASVYRLNFDTGARQLVRTLEMHDPTGGFGVTRVLATPDGQSFAFNTLRDLSELYLLQGLN